MTPAESLRLHLAAIQNETAAPHLREMVLVESLQAVLRLSSTKEIKAEVRDTLRVWEGMLRKGKILPP